MKSGLKTRIKREIPQGIWLKCKKCGHSNYEKALERSHWICPECSHHYAIGHQQYVEMLVDEGTFTETDADVSPTDPLRFRGYKDKIKDGRRQSGAGESVYTGTGRIGGHPVALGIMDTRFAMGTLGGATGEKICRLIDRAISERRTFILICQSGGARMQESAFSLMQMARISAKLHQLSNAGLLYVAILTDPTYGGVTASFAMLGRLNHSRTRCTHRICGTDGHQAVPRRRRPAARGLSGSRDRFGARLYRPHRATRPLSRRIGRAYWTTISA